MSEHPESEQQAAGAGVSPLHSLPAGIVGWVAGWNPEAGVLVDYAGNPHGPLPARVLTPAEPDLLKNAAARHQEVALIFERGDSRLPLVIGLVQPSPASSVLESILVQQSDQTGEEATNAHVDGKRVVIEGKDEVVLKCGRATITLRRNGKVVISGTYVISQAEWTNRIRGGSVQLN